jgi:IS4 transposase
MVIPPPRHRGRKKRPPLKPNQMQGAKYLRNILDLLASLRAHCDCPNRTLHFDEYVAYTLLYFFTPVVTSMRGLQQVSTFDVIHRKLGLPRFSLGAFSEAGRVFDPALLVPFMGQLLDKVADTHPDRRLAHLPRTPILADGTLLRALPKMVWALWVDDEHRAAKLHLQYALLRAAPSHATVTEGNGSERTALKETLAPERLYVLDGGYADYTLLASILEAGSSFVVRVRSCSVYKILEERPVSERARKAGVQEDLLVRLGSDSARQLHGVRLRLIKLRVRDTRAAAARRPAGSERTLWLVSDQLDLDAELVATLYRYRWQIELFFRWFKKILQAEHLLSHSQNGLTIMVYCALIASLLVRLWTGRKPTKRTYEMVCFYFLGWVSEAELAAHIESLPPAVD